jgi:hypothetical protein
MVVALAGRRVDASGAKENRFPNTPANIEAVSRRIRVLLQSKSATVLVSSASCGADLLALQAADSLRIRQRVILPFDCEKFRTTSVTDRPGDWGGLYDTAIDHAEGHGDLVIIRRSSDDQAFAETNHAIIDEALSIGLQLKSPVTAVLVWDGKSRGEGDLSEQFGAYARRRGLPVVEVRTSTD